MMLQLNPTIPLVTDDGKKCTALALIDYSEEHELFFLVGMKESRELWVLSNKRLRLADNITFDRLPTPPIDHSIDLGRAVEANRPMNEEERKEERKNLLKTTA